MHQPYTEITEETIHAMVHGFYDRVRADPLLKDVFNNSIGDQWDPHLATMCRFWSSVLLTSGQYKGNPMMVHMKVDGIKRHLFDRWLELFRETNLHLFTPEIADHIQEKAERIAQSLMLGIFYKPEDVKVGA